MDDCIIFSEGQQPFIKKVSRSSTHIEVYNPVTGNFDMFRFHAVLKGRMTRNPQRFLYAGKGKTDPYEEWDVWQHINHLKPSPVSLS